MRFVLDIAVGVYIGVNAQAAIDRAIEMYRGEPPELRGAQQAEIDRLHAETDAAQSAQRIEDAIARGLARGLADKPLLRESPPPTQRPAP